MINRWPLHFSLNFDWRNRAVSFTNAQIFRFVLTCRSRDKTTGGKIIKKVRFIYVYNKIAFRCFVRSFWNTKIWNIEILALNYTLFADAIHHYVVAKQRTTLNIYIEMYKILLMKIDFFQNTNLFYIRKTIFTYIFCTWNISKHIENTRGLQCSIK